MGASADSIPSIRAAPLGGCLGVMGSGVSRLETRQRVVYLDFQADLLEVGWKKDNINLCAILEPEHTPTNFGEVPQRLGGWRRDLASLNLFTVSDGHGYEVAHAIKLIAINNKEGYHPSNESLREAAFLLAQGVKGGPNPQIASIEDLVVIIEGSII